MGYEACLALPVSGQVLCLLRLAPGVGAKAWWALNSQGPRLPPLAGTALTVQDGRPPAPTLCVAQSSVRHYNDIGKHVAAWPNDGGSE